MYLGGTPMLGKTKTSTSSVSSTGKTTGSASKRKSTSSLAQQYVLPETTPEEVSLIYDGFLFEFKGINRAFSPKKI